MISAEAPTSTAASCARCGPQEWNCIPSTVCARSANRLNYRNHRKIVVVDGHTGFVGGINVADRYLNDPKYRGQTPGMALLARHASLYQRAGCAYLAVPVHGRLELLRRSRPAYYARTFSRTLPVSGKDLVQIAASGPDSERSSIMLSYLAAINQAAAVRIHYHALFHPQRGYI